MAIRIDADGGPKFSAGRGSQGTLRRFFGTYGREKRQETVWRNRAGDGRYGITRIKL
jgi:hypothetical protein